MSNRFKSIDFIDFYITKLAKPEAPIADGFLQITYIDGIYVGDSPRKIAELFMYPNNTNFYNESDYFYELISGEGDDDNAELYVVGRDVYSSVAIPESINFRVSARHTSGYIEEVNAVKEYSQQVNYVFNIDTSVTVGAETLNNQFKLPTVLGESYTLIVNWGDASFNIITSHDQAEATHTYASPGVYQVGITLLSNTGDLAFNGSGDAVKMVSIEAWGGVEISAGMFDGCTNMVVNATDTPTIGTTMERVFRNNASIVTIPGIADWDVSNVVNFDYTFEGTVLFNQNLLE
jgi:hypothetical protein